MRTYHHIGALPEEHHRHCPQHVREQAMGGDRPHLVEILWDELEGFAPEDPGYGHRQYSVRPYRVTDRCDGTRDENALYILKLYLQHAGLDYSTTHTAAYPDEPPKWESELWEDPSWIQREIEPCPLTRENFHHLLDSLYDMNHHSLVALLKDLERNQQLKFTPLQGAK
ncbi:hypothetical protein [Deinococcus roseus]|uniref:Uncharacterized protein n=1 Tax=Deinococcus roseus TaxID=392414 RepID=A0ABQ2DHR9_9DEIO|nr:hypothetical protein [Deinococcus roseus]GGJ55818.1 hypothetical protein GCM10008938_47490 [Deinococcus roseus]